MGLTTFGVVSAGSLTSTWDPSSTLAISQGEIGTISVCKRGVEYSIVKVVKMFNTTRCSANDVLMPSTGSTAGGIATVAIAAQDGHPILGIAAASIASAQCGYAIIGGIATAWISDVATATQLLCVSGSTAAQLAKHNSSNFGIGTLPLTSSFMFVGRIYQAGSHLSAGSSAQIRLQGIWG